MILTSLLLVLLLLFLILPLFFYKKINDDIVLNCNVNPYNNIIEKGEGFIIINDILDEKCRKSLVKFK